MLYLKTKTCFTSKPFKTLISENHFPILQPGSTTHDRNQACNYPATHDGQTMVYQLNKEFLSSLSLSL